MADMPLYHIPVRCGDVGVEVRSQVGRGVRGGGGVVRFTACRASSVPGDGYGAR